MSASMQGALWMVGALLSFSAMAVAVRELLHGLDSLEILFLRSAVSFALVLAVLPRLGFTRLRTRIFHLHVARNLVHLLGQYTWIYAIALLPLATVFAIEFTMPAWTAVLAALFLGERLTRHRIIMLVLGFAGVFIILKPGVAAIQPASLVMLGGAFVYACSLTMTKRMTRDDSTFAVLFYMQLIQLPIAFLFALPVWVTPAAADLPWIAAMGACGLAAHFCMTRALRIADATIVAPIDFLRLPLIAAVGAVFYGEPLEWSVFLGAAVIFGGTYYTIRRESLAPR
jgi:drug/metabolite transporter (DMT)-like permease